MVQKGKSKNKGKKKKDFKSKGKSKPKNAILKPKNRVVKEGKCLHCSEMINKHWTKNKCLEEETTRRYEWS